MSEPTTVDALADLRRRALGHLAADDLPAAEAVIDEITRLVFEQGRADAEAWAHLLRARVARLRGDAEDAGRLATRACAELLALGPTPAAALGLASLARLLDELRRSDEAVEALALSALIADQLTDSSPDLIEACLELASVFAELEVFDAAHRYAERAYVVTLAMGDDLATIDRCLALARQAGRFGDVLARAGDPAASGYHQRAEQAGRLGLDLVERHGGTPDQRVGLELALGSALLGAGRGSEAEPLLHRVLETAADDAVRADALAGLGRAAAAAGDHIRALDQFSRAVELVGGDTTRLPVDVLLALAQSQATVGRTNAAFGTLRTFVEQDQAAQGHRRRRFAEVIGDRLAVITDERALVRRSRALTTDPVTGLADRHHVEGAIDELGKRWAGHDVGLVIVDVDNLDSIRARYGGEAADEVLRRLAALLRVQQRGDDVVARWSDDCFLLLLPRCPEGATELVAGRVRHAVAGVAWSELAFGLTVSVAAGTAAAAAPFDLGALVLEAGTSLALARAMKSVGA